MLAQWHQAQQNALAWRIERAKLPEKWALESFPFKKQPGVSQKQMRAFAEMEFVAKAENIVFIGPTGVGKTGLASSLLLKALQNGHRGRFIRAQDQGRSRPRICGSDLSSCLGTSLARPRCWATPWWKRTGPCRPSSVTGTRSSKNAKPQASALLLMCL
ncbi:MAG: ATP-binding protein [Polyangiaceae bacterium]